MCCRASRRSESIRATAAAQWFSSCRVEVLAGLEDECGVIGAHVRKGRGMNAVSTQTIKRSAVKSRFVKLLGLLFAVTLSGNPVPPAYADPVNIAADTCVSDVGLGTATALIGEQVNLHFTGKVVIVCSVPYSPLPAGAIGMGI